MVGRCGRKVEKNKNKITNLCFLSSFLFIHFHRSTYIILSIFLFLFQLNAKKYIS
jgi:hypothetical protein